MSNITTKSRIKLNWKVNPYDYSKEGENAILSKASKKYGIPKEKIRVIPQFLMLNEKGELILSSDVDNLMRYAQVEENKQTQTIYLEYSEYLLTAAGDRILTEDGDALLWRGDIEE